MLQVLLENLRIWNSDSNQYNDNKDGINDDNDNDTNDI